MFGVRSLNVARLAPKHVGAMQNYVHVNYRIRHFLCYVIYLLFRLISLILFNDQPDAQFFFVYVYFTSLHVSSIQVLIISRFNCINIFLCNDTIESSDDEHLNARNM